MNVLKNITWSSPIVILLGICLLALLGRLIAVKLFWFVPCSLCADPYWYHQTAINFLETGRYVNHSDKALTAFRQPGYTLMLASIYYVFDHAYFMAGVVQSVIGAVCTGLVYVLARHFMSVRLSLACAFIFALWPSLVVTYAHHLYVETAYLFFILVVMTRVAILFRDLTVRNLLLFSLALGLSLYFRPTLILFMPIVFGICIANRVSLARSVAFTGLSILAVLAVMSPWILRNYLLFNEFVITGTYGGYNFAWLSMEPTGYATGTPYYPPGIEPPADRAERVASYIQHEWYWHEHGYAMWLQYVQSDFMGWLELRWKVMYYLWRFDMPRSWGNKSWLFILQPHWVSFMVLAGLGLLATMRRTVVDYFSNRTVPVEALLLAMMLYWNFFHLLFFGHERHHVAVIPVIVLLAVVGWRDVVWPAVRSIHSRCSR